jgi:hypothetical protein
MGEHLTRKLLKRRREMRDTYADGKEQHVWKSYGDAWYEYQNAFETVFPEGIDHWLKERAAAKQGTMVLDVMAPTGTLSSLKRDVGIDGGLALTLEDLRQPAGVQNDTAKNIYAVGGDVVGKKVWRNVRKFIADHNINAGTGFDLVMSRPLAGIHNLPIDRDLYFFVLQQLYQSLSPHEGVLLTTVPVYTRDNIRNWLRELQTILQTTPGIDHRIAESDYNGSPMLMLRKHPNAPARLTGIDLDQETI